MWMCFLCYHSEWLGSYAGLITRCLSSAFSYCLPLQHSHFVSTLLGAGLNKSQMLSVLLGQSSQLFLQCHLFYNSNRLKDLTCHHLKGMTTGKSLYDATTKKREAYCNCMKISFDWYFSICFLQCNLHFATSLSLQALSHIAKSESPLRKSQACFT